MALLVKKFLISIIGLMLLIGGIFSGFIFIEGHMIYSSAIKEIPIKDKVSQIQNTPSYIASEEISEDFLNAIVSIEDRRFTDHRGFDRRSFLRAILSNIESKSFAEGGSTITQQLAKNMYFSHEKKLSRKVAELLVALDIERLYKKGEILELYVNIIYYGDGYYGVKDATYGYFNISPKDMNLDQATLLAGIPNAPSALALSNNLGRARVRQREVVESMVENGYISMTEAHSVLNQ